MFKQVILGLTIAATLAGAILTSAAPAEAAFYRSGSHFGNHVSGFHTHVSGFHASHSHWVHSRSHFGGPYYGSYYASDDCYWSWRRIGIWTPLGRIWTHRHIRYCD